MTRRLLSKSLAVRSDRGYTVTPPETFTTKFLEQTAEGLVPVADSAIIEASLAILAKRVMRGSVLGSPNAVKNFLITRLADLEHEIFGLILLTKRHTLIDFVELFRGTIDVHPSGVKEASHADELITSRLKDSLALIDVRLLDHLIVAGRDTYSFAEAGLL